MQEINGLKEKQVVLDIAKTYKGKLNEYGDITVYMTREMNKCCEALYLGDCLTSRNNYAQRLDADFLVSMNINWDKKSKTTGSNALAAYKSGYNDTIRVKTQLLDKKVVSKLSTIGIKNDGKW